MPSLRKVHIDGREWKYYLRGERRGKLIIFSPDGARHEITRYQYTEVTKTTAPTWDDGIWPIITPGDVKTYIQQAITAKT